MPPEDTIPANVTLPPRWVRPALLAAVWAMLLAAAAEALHQGWLPAFFHLLVPATLLTALFDARRGIERGYATETGMLPGLLLFGVLMCMRGTVNWPLPNAPALGLMLLAAFATVRADPPSPIRARLVWALVAVVLGAWCVYVAPRALGSVAALALYAGWSAWQGKAASARRVLGLLGFVALMGVPAAVLRNGVEFVIVPLSVAAGLVLSAW